MSAEEGVNNGGGGAPSRGFDFNELTSLGLSLFDVRNWYKWCSDLRRVGDGVVHHSLNTWDLFTEHADLHEGEGDEHGSSIRSCPLCPSSGRRPLVLGHAEGHPGLIRTETVDGDRGYRPRGGWIFVPDIEEFIRGGGALPDSGAAESKNVNTSSVPLTPSEQVHSDEPSQTAAKATSPSVKRAKKTRVKSTTANKKSARTKTTRKVSPKKRDYETPLVYNRPKRSRKDE